MAPHAPEIVFGLSPLWVATVLLVLTYVLIITEWLNRSMLAVLGGRWMIVSGVLSQDEAIAGIAFSPIALFTGMMALVSVSRRCGMFEFLAIWSAKRGRAQPWAMLLILSLTTAVLSAFLDNVTTVLLIAPVTLAVTRQLDVPPDPFLFAEIFASNIGGTRILVSDPPDIILGAPAPTGRQTLLLTFNHVVPCASTSHCAA